LQQIGAFLNAFLAHVATNVLHWPGFEGVARPVLAAGIVAAGWFVGRIGVYMLASVFRIALIVAAVLLAYQVMVAK
jgi:hypothetical protein